MTTNRKNPRRQDATPCEEEPAQMQDSVQLRQEELRARKDVVEAGAVGVRKDVVAEQKTMDVPVTREEVVVERHAVERRPSDRPIGEGETIEVPVREERVEVEKRPVVYEEVSVGKREVQETERVSGTVRREEARVERGGDVSLHEHRYENGHCIECGGTEA